MGHRGAVHPKMLCYSYSPKFIIQTSVTGPNILTLYMGKSTERSSRAMGSLLHIITFCRLVNLKITEIIISDSTTDGETTKALSLQKQFINISGHWYNFQNTTRGLHCNIIIYFVQKIQSSPTKDTIIPNKVKYLRFENGHRCF